MIILTVCAIGLFAFLGLLAGYFVHCLQTAYRKEREISAYLEPPPCTPTRAIVPITARQSHVIPRIRPEDQLYLVTLGERLEAALAARRVGVRLGLGPTREMTEEEKRQFVGDN